MKFNLKNFPNPDDCSIQQLEEWFEGFEAEVREMKRKHSPLLKVNLHTIVKEILGE